MLRTMVFVRNLSRSTAFRKSSSSVQWLRRQAKDPYRMEAKCVRNYRARSAFKLLEMMHNNNIDLLRNPPVETVVECGGAPGAWTQVLTETLKLSESESSIPLIISCDLKYYEPIEGAQILPFSDFTDSNTKYKIRRLLNGRGIDFVISDMAPNCSGSLTLDHDRIINLSYDVMRFAIAESRIGSRFLTKIWNGSRTTTLMEDLRLYYRNVCILKPKSSRKESAELYIYASDFMK